MRGKTSLFSACLLLCAAAFAVCGGEQFVSFKYLGFELSLPDGFNFGHTIGGFSATRDTFSMRIESDALNNGESLRLYFIRKTTPDAGNYTTLTDVRMVRLDGVSAMKLTFAYKNETPPSRAVVYYALAHGRGYTVVLHGSIAEFEAWARDLESIVGSIKFLKVQ